MNMHENENKNNYPISEEVNAENTTDLWEEDEGEEDFVEHFKEMFKTFRTEADELTELYNSGQYEALNDALDAKAYKAAKSNKEFVENAEQALELQKYRDYDRVAVKAINTRQKEIISEYRSVIAMESGLPDDVRFSQIENAKNAIAEQLAGEHPSGYTPMDALQTLNIVSIDKDNKKTYRFPEELVPDSTNKLWNIYLAAVCNHVKTQRDLSNHIIDDQSAVEQADKSRTYAHNAITKDLHAILGLEGNDKWDFYSTRQLLANIRDEVFPTMDAPLSKEGLELIKSQSAGLGAIDCLCTSTTDH